MKHETDTERKLRTLINMQKTAMELKDAKIAELETRVNALEADAERYRWLKPRLLGADFDWNEEGNCVLVFEMPNDATVSANCDETIDAAIKGATTKEHGNAICFEPMGK